MGLSHAQVPQMQHFQHPPPNLYRPPVIHRLPTPTATVQGPQSRPLGAAMGQQVPMPVAHGIIPTAMIGIPYPPPSQQAVVQPTVQPQDQNQQNQQIILSVIQFLQGLIGGFQI